MTTLKSKIANIYLSPNFDKKMFILFVVLVFVKMLPLNFFTPLMIDDGTLMGSISILDAIRNEYIHYMTWGGRAVVTFIARVLRMFPKEVFNILNTLVYTGLTLMIYKFAFPKKAYNIPLYIFIVFSIWLYTLSFGQVMLWLTGSVVYLWGTVIILSFLMPYIFYVTGKAVFKHKYIPIAGMFLLGVIAGWCNETTSGGMILIVLFLLIYCKVFKQKIKAWMISGLVGSVIGFLFLLLAPGNFVRLQNYVDERHMLVILSERLVDLTRVLQNNLAVLIIIFIVLATIQILLHKDWKRTLLAFIFFAASIATVYSLALSPAAGSEFRPLFGATVFMFIACSICFAGISFEKMPYKVALISFLCVLTFQFSTTYAIAFVDNARTRAANNRIEQFIESEIAAGNRNVLLPHHLGFILANQTPWNARYGFVCLSHDVDNLMNINYALIYGLESIRWAPY